MPSAGRRRAGNFVGVNIRPVGQSVRPSPIFLAIVALTAVGGVLAWLAASTASALAYAGVFIFVVAGWVVSLCLHEFGHAYTAWRYGDHDVAVRGYLTLNPLKYTSPLLSVVLPVVILALGGIGFPGGAVYVRTWGMTARQRSVVNLAGPFANIVLAVILLVLVKLLATSAHGVFWAGVAFLAFLQITAAVLNLIPIPGLDGYGALEPHLSADTQRALQPFKQWAFIIILVLLLTPQINQYFFSIVFWFFDLSGINTGLVGAGMSFTQFWSAWF